MSNELDTNQDRGIQTAESRYSDQEREQLRALMNAGDASDGDLDMLAQVAHRTGLDPFAKQIYLVGRQTKTGGYRGEPERWETKWTVQSGIDGFRAVTHRVADQKGLPVVISKPQFYDREGNTRPFWIKEWGNPAACEVQVKLGDSVGYGIATWDEYCQTKKNGGPTAMWEKMGPTMLAKCAEAQAHRRVTPLTAGVYTPEEMQQQDGNVYTASATRTDRGMDGVRAALEAKKNPKKRTQEDVLAAIGNATEVAHIADIMGWVEAHPEGFNLQELEEAADQQAHALNEQEQQ